MQFAINLTVELVNSMLFQQWLESRGELLSFKINRLGAWRFHLATSRAIENEEKNE